MAVHGADHRAHGRPAATRAASSPALGMWCLRVNRLDDIDTDLIASAERLAGDTGSTLYQFTVSGGERGKLLSGPHQ